MDEDVSDWLASKHSKRMRVRGLHCVSPPRASTR
jgi:hypothetical protein